MLAKGLHPLSAIFVTGCCLPRADKNNEAERGRVHLMVDFTAEGNAADTSPVACVLPLGGAMVCADSPASLVFLDLLRGWCFESDWVGGGVVVGRRVTGDKQGGPTEDRGRTVQHLDLGEAE